MKNLGTVSMEELNKSLSQRERGRAAAVRGTASNNNYLWYPSPGLRPPSPVGRGILLIHHGRLWVIERVTDRAYN
jgi:hypothetical protein